MPDWNPGIACPTCHSTDTRFVEYREELSVYECTICGCRIETDEGN